MTSSRVGHTGARTTLADASYHKVHSTRFGAGHRVGIQNAPAGGPLTDSPIHDKGVQLLFRKKTQKR